MNLYLLRMFENPTPEHVSSVQEAEFAHFSALGAWSEDSVCEVCGVHSQTRIPPLIMRWEPSTQTIGDFSWDGPFGYLCVVLQDVANELRERGLLFDKLDVEYAPPKPGRRYPCVEFPYSGPPQVWMSCNTFLQLDREASGVTKLKSCDVCGFEKYVFKREGIVIQKEAWRGKKMFRIASNGRSFATFVSEEGRQEILAAGCTNVSFSLAGKISG